MFWFEVQLELVMRLSPQGSEVGQAFGGGGSGAGAGSPSAGGTGGPESLGPERCSQRPPALGTEGRVPGPDLPCFRMLIALTQRRR